MKLKLPFKIAIIILVLAAIAFSVLYFFPEQTNKKIAESEINYVEEFIAFNIGDVTDEFIIWFSDNYRDELIEMVNFLNTNEYDVSIWREFTGNSLHVLNDDYNNIELNRIATGNDVTVVGDVSLADNYYIMQAYNWRNQELTDILDQDVITYLNDSALTIANSEFTFGYGENKLPGKQFAFYANPENVSLYHEMGVDLVTLANNHIFDFGIADFNTTLETLDNAGIKRIGAGQNLEEASRAEYYVLNGYKVAFLSANRSEKTILTPGATETDAGVFRCYDPQNLLDAITLEKTRSDIVVPIIHWGAEGEHRIEPVIQETGKQYIDAGADVIIGHHAHEVQGIEYYKGKPIFYNLGNFLFDNYSREVAVLNFTINDDMSIDYLFKLGLQADMKTKFLEGDQLQVWTDKVNSWSINASIDIEGNVVEK